MHRITTSFNRIYLLLKSKKRKCVTKKSLVFYLNSNSIIIFNACGLLVGYFFFSKRTDNCAFKQSFSAA